MSIIGDTFVPHLISVKEQSNSAQIVNVGATLCTSSKVPNTGIRSGTTIFLLAALILAAAQSVFAQSQDIVPLKAGSIWKYRGRACWTIADSTRTKCSNIRWEMRVLQSVTENGKTAALVAGFPLDLAWYDPTTKPGYTVVSEDSQGLYFKSATSKAQAKTMVTQALAGKAPFQQIVRFPIRVGDCIGDASPRPDKRYCWYVRGRSKGSARADWEIAYETVPDVTILSLVPGVGFTRYTYRHRGTVSSVTVHLVE